MRSDSADPGDLAAPIRLALLPDREWEAVLEGAGVTFAYRDPCLAQAYARAQKWAGGPTRPFLSEYADAVVANLGNALAAFDELVETLVAEGLREGEIKFLLNGTYFEELALRVLFGMMRSAINERASPYD